MSDILTRLARARPVLRPAARATDDSGTSAVEFALIAPLFCLILVGVIEIGGILYAKFTLDGSVSAAANYAMLNASNVSSTSGPSLATRLAEIVASGHAANWANANIVVNNGPAVTLSGGAITSGGIAANADYCYCPIRNSSGLTWGSAMICGNACSGGGIAGKFVSISATRAYSPVFSNFALVGSNETIGAAATVEAQ